MSSKGQRNIKIFLLFMTYIVYTLFVKEIRVHDGIASLCLRDSKQKQFSSNNYFPFIMRSKFHLGLNGNDCQLNLCHWNSANYATESNIISNSADMCKRAL